MKVTLQQLLFIAPHSGARAGRFLPYLNKYMGQYGIDTPLRAAHFLAQAMHESGELQFVRELASGAAYEGRKDLGNSRPGDGRLYKGRGLLQVTGRNNYTKLAKDTGLDVVRKPALLELPQWAAMSACWYWAGHGLNALADKDNLTLVTKRINGGTNGIKQRAAYLERAKKAFGI